MLSQIQQVSWLGSALATRICFMHWGSSRTCPLTRSGEIIGTLRYMPPEQFDDADADVEAMELAVKGDIYSLGAVFYECLSLVPAFSGESVSKLMRRILLGNSTPAAEPPLQLEEPTAQQAQTTSQARGSQLRQSVNKQGLSPAAGLQDQGEESQRAGETAQQPETAPASQAGETARE